MLRENQSITAAQIEPFLDALDAKSPATTETHRRALRPFFEYATARGLSRFTRQDIKDYRDALQAKNLSAATIGSYMSSVRKFFAYLELSNLHDDVSKYVRSVQTDGTHKKKSFFSEDEVATLLQSIPTDDEKGKRNYAMIYLSVTTGLLGIEMSRAKIEDLKILDGKPVLYVQGKGCQDKNNYVLLPEKVLERIEAYLAERETAPDDAALFSSLRGKEPREALKPREIRNCIKACIIKSGIKGAEDKSVQSLRHTAALIALKHQEGIEDVNRHMRHKTIESTYVYMEHAEKLSNTCSHTVAHAIATANPDLSSPKNQKAPP